MLHERIQTLAEVQTPYQHAVVAILPKYGKCLFLDTDLQSAAIDQEKYHTALVEPAFRLNPNIRRVLVLGGGEGSTIHQVLKHQVDEVVMVDIDPTLIEICKEHLPEWSQGSFNDVRLTLVTADAAKFIVQNQKPFDLIIWDLVDSHKYEDKQPTAAAHVYTREIFERLKSLLTKNGLLSVEYGRRNRKKFSTLIEDWKSVCKQEIYLRSFEERWIFEVLTK